MSFIRSLSNPEGLYIYNTMEDLVWIHHSVKPPLASKSSEDHIPHTFSVPERDFLAIGRKWARNFWNYDTDEICRSGKLTVGEVHVFMDTGKKVHKGWVHRHFFERRSRRTEFLIKLAYGKHYVMMWRTTWHYIVHSILDHLKLDDDGRPKKRQGKK
jgi:hypothetical protein